MLEDSEISESRSLTDIVQSLDWTTVDYGDDVRDFPFLDSIADACPQLLDPETCCPQGAQLMQMASAAGVVTSITPTAVPELPEVDMSFQPLVLPLMNHQQLLQQQQQQQLMNCKYMPDDFNESLRNSGTILRSEEPYFQWTAQGNQSLFFDDDGSQNCLLVDEHLDSTTTTSDHKFMFRGSQLDSCINDHLMIKTSSSSSDCLVAGDAVLNPVACNKWVDPDMLVGSSQKLVAELVPVESLFVAASTTGLISEQCSNGVHNSSPSGLQQRSSSCSFSHIRLAEKEEEKEEGEERSRLCYLYGSTDHEAAWQQMGTTAKLEASASANPSDDDPFFHHLRQTSTQYSSAASSFTQSLLASSWASATDASSPTMDHLHHVHNNVELAAWPTPSRFLHSHKSPFTRSCGSYSNYSGPLQMRGVGDRNNLRRWAPRQSLLRRWTEKIVPVLQQEARRQKQLDDLEQLELAAKCNPNPTLTSCAGQQATQSAMVRSNPAQNRAAAHIHKLAERGRRSKFKEKLHTIRALVPLTKKKDRVSILSHAIDYILQLKTEVAELQKSQQEEQAAAQECDLAAEAGSSSSSSLRITAASGSGTSTTNATAAPATSRLDLKVAVSCPGDESDDHQPQQQQQQQHLVINVKVADKLHAQKLISLLTASKDLGLEIRSLDCRCINDQFHVAVKAVVQACDRGAALEEHGLQNNMVRRSCSLEQVQETLTRVLDFPFEISPGSVIPSSG